MHRIGNLPALMEKLYLSARREGNEAEHELGCKLVNLARDSGIPEDDIIKALCDTPDGPVFYYP